MTTPFVFPEPPWPVVSGVDHGSCLSLFLRSVSLPMPDGSTRTTTIFDLAADSAMVSGRQCLAEALARRLVTARGTLISNPDYGTDVTAYVNDDIDARTLAKIASEVDGEMLKDERVVHSATTAAFLGGVLVLSVNITDGLGPFKLVLSVSDVTVSILQVGT